MEPDTLETRCIRATSTQASSCTRQSKTLRDNWQRLRAGTCSVVHRLPTTVVCEGVLGQWSLCNLSHQQWLGMCVDVTITGVLHDGKHGTAFMDRSIIVCAQVCLPQCH